MEVCNSSAYRDLCVADRGAVSRLCALSGLGAKLLPGVKTSGSAFAPPKKQAPCP